MVGCRTIRRKTVFKEKGFLIFVLILLFSFFFIPNEVAEAYNKRSSVVLMDADTLEILYSENPNEKMEIASTTKILTALTAIENSDIFSVHPIPREAVGVEGSSIYLREGDRWRVLDLLFGLMLRSGNDAATALALIVSGEESSFCALMNQTARKIGALESSFVNPHGLHSDDHYATARDMALITAYAMKSPIFAAICKTKTHSFFYETSSGERIKTVFYNKNKLLYSYPPATGVKTGYTKHSGRCLVSSASKNGRNLICVVLNVYDTYGVSRNLFERFFEKTGDLSIKEENA